MTNGRATAIRWLLVMSTPTAILIVPASASRPLRSAAR